MHPSDPDYAKTCGRCKITKHKSNFNKNQTYTDKLSGLCKVCQRKDERKSRILRLYGITEEVYSNMSRSQNFVCAICKRPSIGKKTGLPVRLAVDHNHTTGKIRGLLCLGCNVSLGYLRDAKTLVSAIEYLARNDG